MPFRLIVLLRHGEVAGGQSKRRLGKRENCRSLDIVSYVATVEGDCRQCHPHDTSDMRQRDRTLPPECLTTPAETSVRGIGLICACHKQSSPPRRDTIMRF